MRWIRRILLVIVGLPLLLVLGLWIAGRREGAGHTQARIDIAHPPAQVFRHIADEQLLKDWAGLAEVTPLTEGGLRTGSRSRMVLESRGQRTEFEGEVAAVEPDRYVDMLLKSPPGASVGFVERVQYRLEPHDGGTRLTVTGDTRYEGLVLKLLEPLITREAQRQLETSVARLKEQVESAPSTSSSR